MNRPKYLNNDADISTLTTASLTSNHLFYSSKAHNDAFSAIAELIDNSWDSDAHWCHINITGTLCRERLEVLDDGRGMTREEALRVIQFGHSDKAGDYIGRYGHGLKSGGLQLGRDLMVLTKRDGEQTAIFLSQTLQEKEKVQETVYVPCPTIKNGKPYSQNPEDLHRFNDELSFIYKNALLAPDETLTELFERIKGDTGTLVLVFKLARNFDGSLQMRVRGNDIHIQGDPFPPHKIQMSEYLKILYLVPKMNITICGKTVVQRKVVEGWMGRSYVKMNLPAGGTEGFKISSRKYDHKAENLERRLANVDSLYAEMSSRNQLIMTTSEKTALDKKHEAETNSLKARIKKQKNLRDITVVGYKNLKLQIVYGLEVEHRARDGIHYYINNRLILFGYRPSFYTDTSFHGISAYCQLDYDHFRPNSTKQDFLHDSDFRWLTKRIEKHLQTYHDYLERVWIPAHLKENWKHVVTSEEDVWATFWKMFGYDETHDPLEFKVRKPFNEQQIKVFEEDCGIWRYCGSCGKWNKLDPSSQLRHLPVSNLQCSMIPKQSCVNRKFVPIWTDEEASIDLEQVKIPAASSHSKPREKVEERKAPTFVSNQPSSSSKRPSIIEIVDMDFDDEIDAETLTLVPKSSLPSARHSRRSSPARPNASVTYVTLSESDDNDNSAPKPSSQKPITVDRNQKKPEPVRLTRGQEPQDSQKTKGMRVSSEKLPSKRSSVVRSRVVPPSSESEPEIEASDSEEDSDAYDNGPSSSSRKPTTRAPIMKPQKTKKIAPSKPKSQDCKKKTVVKPPQAPAVRASSLSKPSQAPTVKASSSIKRSRVPSSTSDNDVVVLETDSEEEEERVKTLLVSKLRAKHGNNPLGAANPMTAEELIEDFLKTQKELEEMQRLTKELFTNKLRVQFGDGLAVPLVIPDYVPNEEKLNFVTRLELPRLQRLHNDAS